MSEVAVVLFSKGLGAGLNVVAGWSCESCGWGLLGSCIVNIYYALLCPQCPQPSAWQALAAWFITYVGAVTLLIQPTAIARRLKHLYIIKARD